MAGQIRRPISGKKWTTRELLAYNISIVREDEQSFFGGPLPKYAGPAGFAQHENPVPGIDEPSFALMKRARLKVMDGCESNTDDYTAEMLRVLGFETEETIVCMQKNIPLTMCRRRVNTNADVCIMDHNSDILLVGQEDKSHLSLLMDPEPPLVAQMIAAFQINNWNRVNQRALHPLRSQNLSGIALWGPSPRFYKAGIIADLAECIESGQYPAKETLIHRCIPRPPLGVKY
ncbi:hypothetical protein M405DRAFT_761101, partial [Rhizopogon salebrosus TDB-379]